MIDCRTFALGHAFDYASTNRTTFMAMLDMMLSMAAFTKSKRLKGPNTGMNSDVRERLLIHLKIARQS